MTHSSRVSGAARRRLTELALLLRGCRDASARVGADHHRIAAPGSVCASDLAAFRAVAAVSNERLVLEAVLGYLELAAAQCAGLAALLDTGEVVAAPWPLTRAILEDCARARWIIGSQPTAEPALNRLARAYIDNDMSAEYEKKISGYLRGNRSPACLAATARFIRLRAEIAAVFPGTSGHDFGKRTIHGQVCLGPTDTVRWFFDLLARSAALAVDTKAPTAIYDLLSTHTHPTLHSVHAQFLFTADTMGSVTPPTIDIAGAEWLACLAALGVYDAVSVTHRYCGWEFDPDGRLESLIDRVLPGLPRPADPNARVVPRRSRRGAS
ncbi:hypothetical protein [Nocardia brevicatena]|uniref:hypothetical protein n=1 Tax=Nocardia brevicatena TaxID=37327 RepID=UPI00068672FA|nr:hypothetical protein [Nocardia brevicatena]